MKFLSFVHDGRASYGAVGRDGGVVDLGSRASEHPDLRHFIASDRAMADTAAAATSDFSLDDITFLPVIPKPDKILCVGLNYESHRLETGRPEEQYPVIFTRFAESQVGHLQPLVRPVAVSTAFDYEGEVAVVIGKSGYRIAQERAIDHVAGYACYNDATARDWQRHTHQFTPGKNFPGTGAFGPYLVTPDEVGELAALRLTTRLNGNVVQEAGLDQFIFTVPHLIAYCSTFTPLRPGDVILTGTPGGVGFKRNPPLFMKPDDRIEVEVTRLGILSNRVVDEDLAGMSE